MTGLLDWFASVDPGDLLIALIAAIGLGFTILSIQKQTTNSRLEKVADVLMDCTRRFGDLIELRHSLERDVANSNLPVRQAARRYYSAYWNLQWDQYNYFLLGLLPREVLATWFMERLALLKRNESILGTSFSQGWEDIGRSQMVNYADFSTFVDLVWTMAESDRDVAKKKIDEALKKSFKNSKAMRASYR